MDSNGKMTIRKGMTEFNPVLFQCVGLCTAIAGTTTLQDAFSLSVVLSADLLICCFAASALLKKVPRFLRIVFYLVIGLGAICCPVLWFIEKRTVYELSLGMKIILPLVAVNSVTAVHCETYSVKHNVSEAFTDAVAAALGTSAVYLICGFLRELFGNGTIAGVEVKIPFRLSGFSQPFGCLVLLGFAAAFLKAVLMFASRDRNAPQSGEESPEEVEMDMPAEPAPEKVELDLSYYDDIDYILSSTDEFLKSITGGDGGDGE